MDDMNVDNTPIESADNDVNTTDVSTNEVNTTAVNTTAVNTTEVVQTEGVNNISNNNGNKKKKKVGLIIGIIAAVVVVSVVLILIISSANKGPLYGKWKVKKIDGNDAKDFLCDYEFIFKDNYELEIIIPGSLTDDGKPEVIQGTYQYIRTKKDDESGLLWLYYDGITKHFFISDKKIGDKLELDDKTEDTYLFSNDLSLNRKNGKWELVRE